MNITIEVHLNIQGTRLSKGGNFNLKYNEDVPIFAYNWINQIKRETGYRPTIIEKVLVNGDNDITLLVKSIDEAPIPDLDFLW
jgi:hypothetical protein